MRPSPIKCFSNTMSRATLVTGSFESSFNLGHYVWTQNLKKKCVVFSNNSTINPLLYIFII